MSMTIEQAIEHAEEVSNKCQNFVTAHKEDRELEFIQRTEKCAAEHRQLAEWLRELRERRKAPKIIFCHECKHWKDSDGVYRRGISAESKCPVNSRQVYEGTFFCGMAERRTDGT